MRRRLLVFGALVSGALGLAAFFGTGAVMGPAVERLGHNVARLAVTHALAQPDPSARERALDDALTQLDLEVSVYGADGALVATNVKPPLQRAGLASPGAVSFELGGLHAVGRPTRPVLPVGGGLTIVALAAVLVFFLSIPFARVTTRPLERLALAARRFGEGQLAERAPVEGPDEIASTARAFNSMADRIATLRRLERELIANVSHELKTPLARMRVVLELLETNPDAARRYVSELGADLAELQQLTDDVITTTHLQLAEERATDPYPLALEPHDLGVVAGELCAEFEARTGRRVTLEREGPVVLTFDRGLVRRALRNLLENAHRHSPHGREIVVRVLSPARLEVQDEGEGISQDDLPRVFDPFFRADRSRTRRTGGTGLGLTFVKRVAELHRGDVTVTSSLGRGTTFRLTLA
ncbi:MAG: HAMP domain-containing sensor histidine kinase [Myxococcaceae bacterium]|nr:HAMP domain-containing sensor histidine kinase [Myxococcaceae bacterium]